MEVLLANSGIAYSKHIVHIYSYHGGDDLRNHLEVSIHLYLLVFFLLMNNSLKILGS